MAEKAGVAYLYLIICELCELCEQMPSVYFLRKVSMFFSKSCEQEKVRTISRQEALSRPSLQGGCFCSPLGHTMCPTKAAVPAPSVSP